MVDLKGKTRRTFVALEHIDFESMSEKYETSISLKLFLTVNTII